MTSLHTIQPCLVSQNVEYIWDYLKDVIIHSVIEMFVPSIQV